MLVLHGISFVKVFSSYVIWLKKAKPWPMTTENQC